jgi:serine/threonine protein kinase
VVNLTTSFGPPFRLSRGRADPICSTRLSNDNWLRPRFKSPRKPSGSILHMCVSCRLAWRGMGVEGTPFGHYRLLTLLGRGGMGEVWRAHDTATDRVVALKLLPPHLAGDEVFQKRFRREARVAAGLYEPHIVPIHSYGEIDGRLYVDMRLITGQDLEVLLKSGALDPIRAVTIVEQVASALQAAHDVGLIHRDVKPSNVLVAQSDFAYLIDFGIARTAGTTGLTSTGSTIGTWAYMAPERFGPGDPDPRSDVYALACVLHQCLTGQPPFPGASVEQQVAGHLSTPPPRPSLMVNGIPAEFDDVIAKGMAKNPDERYATPTELADGARAAYQRPPLPTTRSSHYGRTSTAPPPYAPNIPREAKVVGAQTLVSTSADTQYREAGSATPIFVQPTHVPAQSKSWRRPAIAIPAALGVVALIVVGIIMVNHGSDSAPAQVAAPTLIKPPTPVGPSFDGTFTVLWGPRTNLDGIPQTSTGGRTTTWVVRSFCDRSGCVASSTSVNQRNGVFAFTFDYIDGRWVAIGEEPGGKCGDASVTSWIRFTLEPHPDGSLTGDQVSITAPGGCNSRYPVTFDRTGDADPRVQVTDPAIASPRTTSPAQGFRGRYHAIMQYTEGTKNKFEYDYGVDTLCLRNGERCVSLAHNPDHRNTLVFGDNQWLSTSVDPGSTCGNGSARHGDYHAVYPLPPSSNGLITTLDGTGEYRYEGSCNGTMKYTLHYTRTGD